MHTHVCFFLIAPNRKWNKAQVVDKVPQEAKRKKQGA